TDNGGALSWSLASPAFSTIETLVADSSDTTGQTVYAGTSQGVYLTTNGGSDWTQMITGLSNLDVQGLLVDTDPSTGAGLYAATAGGVFKLQRCGGGVVGYPQEWDDGNTIGGDCCSASCQFEAATVVCRPAAGDCDVAEYCTGSSADCPADIKEPDATACTDGSLCTTSDHCSSGVCVGTTVVCDDSSACTSDACNPGS